MKNIKLFAQSSTMILAGLAALPAVAFADLKGDVSGGVNSVGAGGGINISDIFATATNLLSYVVGAAAIIVIVYSGLRFVTSNGDSNKVSGAKNALVYALIGVVVAALAQFLVHFVLNRSTN
jgi:hypothetical protein